MKDKYIAQAETQEEAVIQGLNALGIEKDEAIIKVEEPGKKGFLGIGQKDAVVIVERKEKLNVVDEFLASEFDIGRNRSTNTSTETAEEDEKLEEAKAQEDEMDKEEMLEGREQAEVEIVEEETQQADTAETTKEDKEEKESSEPTEAEIYDKDQKAIEDVRQYLHDIIEAMGVTDVEVYTSRVENNAKYDIETENAGLVIGRHGKVLNGLQTLTQNHMHQLAYSKINVRVDAEKYRERRKKTVKNLGKRTAQKAIKQKRTIKLDPMPAHERKQIHRALNGNPEVKTYSEGRDPKRYLVIEPTNQK